MLIMKIKTNGFNFETDEVAYTNAMLNEYV